MNKRILPVFVFCALCYSAQAQDAKGGISDAMMQQIKQSYQNTSADKAIRNAIGSNDIRKLALNQDNMKGMDTHFSVKVNSKGITNQKSSGRCWLFTFHILSWNLTTKKTLLFRLVFIFIDNKSKKELYFCQIIYVKPICQYANIRCGKHKHDTSIY